MVAGYRKRPRPKRRRTGNGGDREADFADERHDAFRVAIGARVDQAAPAAPDWREKLGFVDEVRPDVIHLPSRHATARHQFVACDLLQGDDRRFPDPDSPEPAADAPDTSDIIYPSAVPFVLVHFACLGAISTGVTMEALAISVGLYWLRIFAIGAGYHRYFSHRAYETSRAFQFILAVVSPEHLAKERVVVGVQPPRPSPLFRHRARRSFAAPYRISVQSSWLDFLFSRRHSERI